MNKLAIPLFLLSTACSFSPYAHSAESDETWWITPRFGGSSSTGMFGIEVQIDNIALAGGIWPPVAGGGCQGSNSTSIWAYGAKYYFNAAGDSWSLGLFSLPLDDRFNGISVDYRWRWTRWDLTAGMGYGKDRTYTGPLPSFAVGYSF